MSYKAIKQNDAFQIELDVFRFECPTNGKIEIRFKKPSLYFAFHIKEPFAERNLANYHQITLRESERQLREGIESFLHMIKRQLEEAAAACLEELKVKAEQEND